MEDFEFNMTVTAMEIAHGILTDQYGEGVRESVLENLDISDDEACCLEQNIASWLEEEPCV